MSEPSKIRTWWLIVAAVPAFLLGALLFRGCKGAASPCPPSVNIDSLLATIPPDTVILPGKQDTIRKTRVVNLKDTAEVNALRRELEENSAYADAQLASLKKIIGEYESKERQEAGLAAWNMLFRANTWSDSLSTPLYKHWWTIEAEGKILSYRPRIEPIFPACPSCEPLPVIRNHRIGAFAGLQTEAGTLRQIYGPMYRYKFFQVQAGYLPPIKKLGIEGAVQVSAGLDFGIK